LRIERSDLAVEDLDDIWWFIAQDNERRADELVDLLTAAFERLGDAPGRRAR
jgi:plasmid stabilization system protein ParE